MTNQVEANRTENSYASGSSKRIREQLCNTIARYETANPRDVTYRLAQLDQEWDIERIAEFNFSSLVLAGLALGTLSNRKWYVLPALASCFMMQYAMQGWCPPLVVLRRLGFRTAAEINRERMALKIVRGDFADQGAQGSQESAFSLLRAVEE